MTLLSLSRFLRATPLLVPLAAAACVTNPATPLFHVTDVSPQRGADGHTDVVVTVRVEHGNAKKRFCVRGEWLDDTNRVIEAQDRCADHAPFVGEVLTFSFHSYGVNGNEFLATTESAGAPPGDATRIVRLPS